jgi:DNA ligase-associated metallophosphoesterase
MRLELAPGELVLLPEHAVLDPLNRCLMVADLHLGKGFSFRSRGVNVPAGSTLRTLALLDDVLLRYRPAVLYILGDLMHDARAHHPAVLDALSAWRKRHSDVVVRLLTGNHDRHAGGLPAQCGIECPGAEERLGGWLLKHEPPDTPAPFTIAGHVHPVVRIGSALDSLVRPCFWLRPRALVLPAFGAFTGGGRVALSAGERVFVALGAEVVEASAAIRTARPRNCAR